MNQLNLNAFLDLYHYECNRNNDLLITKICALFPIRPTHRNKSIISEKIHYYIVKNSAKFYDVWIKCSKVKKEQQFSDIIVLTKNDFQSFLSFDIEPSGNFNNESSTFTTTNKLSISAATTASSTTLTATSTPTYATTTKRQYEFSDISSRQKRRRLSDLNSEFDDFATANNITVNQVIGYLLYQHNYNNNKYLARFGQELYEGKNIERPDLCKLDIDQTLALKSHLNLSRVDMNFVKCFSSDFIIVPNEKAIRAHSNTLIPSITNCRDKKGIMVNDRQQALQLTIQRIIDVLQLEMIQVPNELCYREKTGHDSAGSMAIYKSTSNPMNDPNIFSKMFVPLSLKEKGSDRILWENQSPNSAFCARPLLLVAEKETRDLLRFVNQTFEPVEKHLEGNGLKFKYKNVAYTVQVKMESSMKDLKVRMSESGLGGAECLMYDSRQKDWKDLQKISDSNYFNINRTAKKTLELYNQLVDDDGKIYKYKNDYETRVGLTSEPLSTSDHHFITITHQYINGTNWILKIMYHMKAHILTWTVRNKAHQKLIEQAKISILKEIENKIGLKLDQCNSGSRTAGGTSTTGAQGRKFFSYEIRHLLLACVPLQHQDTLKQLIQRYSIVLRAVSSTQSINVSKFKELTLGFQIIIANQKWIDYSMTVHNLIFHSTELIERNNGVALGELSEEALESCNKDVRNYREFLSRKCGHTMNLTDVFNRLFIRSDPVMRKVIKDSFSKRQTHVSQTLIQPENEDDKLLKDVFLCN